MKTRTATVTRKTRETDIALSLTLDGTGQATLKTGIGFFDHMLNALARTSLFDVTVQAKGDLYVDQHHTIEDVGIVLGQAFAQAIGDRAGIRRFANALLPMDEALVRVALDISGRAFLHLDGDIPTNPALGFDTQMVEEFFRAFASNAWLTPHIDLLKGRNTHHIVEAIFKAVGLALRQAVEIDPKIQGVLSTK
ncbi:MAG: imidazoleglycerol-phosphate dehydratase HisB [Calditrichaeota bacterium]|nr:imidazoleglycerol-phosphate dehydratase HisB [Calditrichota bacterium]